MKVDTIHARSPPLDPRIPYIAPPITPSINPQGGNKDNACMHCKLALTYLNSTFIGQSKEVPFTPYVPVADLFTKITNIDIDAEHIR